MLRNVQEALICDCCLVDVLLEHMNISHGVTSENKKHSQHSSIMGNLILIAQVIFD